MVDGCRSKLVSILLGVPQGCVSSLLLFFLYTSELLYIPENKLIGYADVPSPCASVKVAESLIRYLCRVSEWCDFGE